MMFMDPDGNRGIKFLLQLIKDEVHKNSHSTKAPAIGYSLKNKKNMQY